MPKSPKPEVEYFGKMDVKKKKRIAEAKREKLKKEEIALLKNLHYHRCGECGMELEEIPFKGVIVHKCFNCGAVLLPDGTLDTLCGEEMHVIDSLLDLFKF